MPALGPRQRKDIIGDMWDNIGRVLAEYPHLTAIADPARKRLEIVGVEALQECLAQHPSAIFFSGHLANWEVLQQAAARMQVPMVMIYRRPNNTLVEKLLMQARGGTDETHIPKGHSGARRAMMVLKNKGNIAMLVDQKLNEGLAIPFFGSPAMTAPAIAHFALRFNCPIIPTRVERLNGARFRVTLYPPLYMDKESIPDASIEAMLIKINMILESWIKERPAQWLWIHRRWGKFFNQQP
jgi:KDO2-lipid IV(A) lauroyltransferase